MHCVCCVVGARNAAVVSTGALSRHGAVSLGIRPTAGQVFFFSFLAAPSSSFLSCYDWSFYSPHINNPEIERFFKSLSLSLLLLHRLAWLSAAFPSHHHHLRSLESPLLCNMYGHYTIVLHYLHVSPLTQWTGLLYAPTLVLVPGKRMPKAFCGNRLYDPFLPSPPSPPPTYWEMVVPEGGNGSSLRAMEMAITGDWCRW